jgi:hypothetical protein
LLEHGQEGQPQYRSFRVVTRDAPVLRENFSIRTNSACTCWTPRNGWFHSKKLNLREYGLVRSAPLPSYKNKLTQEEATDLIAYLASLEGATRQ